MHQRQLITTAIGQTKKLVFRVANLEPVAKNETTKIYSDLSGGLHSTSLEENSGYSQTKATSVTIWEHGIPSVTANRF